MKLLLELASFFFCSLAFASENSFERFHEANQAYDKGEYQTAIQGYQTLVSEGFQSGGLHFNLGNAHFKNGSLGHSIFHYRQAIEFSPRDPDINFNLGYAREKVTDQIENRESFWSRIANLCEKVSQKESYYGLFVSTLLFFGVCVFALYKTQEWIKSLRNGLSALCMVSLILVVYHSFLQKPFGVVIAQETKVYSAVGKDNVVLFTLHEGVEVSVADFIGKDWVRIRLSDGKQGWVKTDGLIYEKGSPS